MQGDEELSVPVPLDQLLAEVASSHPANQLQLNLEAMEVIVKPVALSRAVANLIDNAFTYGEAPVVLRLLRVEDQCCIEVWDQGEGMPQRQWEQALQPFHRLDASRGGQGHCGLGLAIVVHVARLHGGHLNYSYGKGVEGTEAAGRFAIRLYLPVK